MESPDRTLRVLAVGGTFDKRYDPVSGQLVFGDSHLPALLAQARLNRAPAFETVLQIDSLDMDGGHRALVRTACLRAPETALVLVHGTDTMVETAACLQDGLEGRTVVLTGAMVPSDLAASDAFFNLGFALACAQTLPAGVWIAMGGQVWAANAVRKNRAAGRFESR